MPPKSKDKSPRVTIFNVGRTPVVYSAQGHTIGSAEWRVVDSLDEVGQRAVDSGALLVPDSVVWPEDEAKDTGESDAADQA